MPDRPLLVDYKSDALGDAEDAQRPVLPRYGPLLVGEERKRGAELRTETLVCLRLVDAHGEHLRV